MGRTGRKFHRGEADNFLLPLSATAPLFQAMPVNPHFFRTLKFNMSKVFLLHVVNDDQYLASWKEGRRYSFCDEIRIIFSLLLFAI